MPLTIYRRGKIWHYRGTVAGRRLRGSTRTADKTIAQRVAAEKEARSWKGHLDGPASVLTFAQAAILYRAAQKPTRFLDRIEDYWRDTPVKEITNGAIRKAALELFPSAGPATRNRQGITPIQAIINHAAEAELCPVIRVKRFHVPKKEKHPASWAWVQALASVSSPHLAALACFLFLTGSRISEALSLSWNEVNLSAKRALIKQTKIGSERWAHLPPELVVALANIPGGREGKVFRYSSYQTAKWPWRAAIVRAGIKPLTFHACRHGFATGLLAAGVNPMDVAKRGGWKSAQHVFATYGHATEDETITDVLTGTQQTRSSHRKAKGLRQSSG